MISVVIPVKNGGPSFRRCLEAIRSQQVDDDVEVIVVDSGSTDGTVEFARSLGARVHEIPPAEFNHGETRNVGARLAKADVVVFTVDDALPLGSDWLDRLVSPLRDPHRQNLCATFGRQVAHDHAPPYQRFYIADRYGSERRVLGGSVPEDLAPGVVFSNVASAILREVIVEHPFAADIVIAEDAEWAQRAILAGYSIEYVPGAVVRHSHEYSLGDAVKRYFDLGAASERLRVSGHGGSPDRVRREGLQFVRRELGWLLRNRGLTDVPATLAFEAARFTGFQLGVHNRRLPPWVRRRISRTEVYWSD